MDCACFTLPFFQDSFVIHRHHLHELRHRGFERIEHLLGLTATRVHEMLGDQPVEQLLVYFRHRLQFDHPGVTTALEGPRVVQYERRSPGHTGGKVAACPTKHHDHATRHVLTS